MVAQGFSQQEGIDYGKTFNLVVKHVTIQALLSIAFNLNWPIRQLDVNGFLREEVYMYQPVGVMNPRYPHHVYHLHKKVCMGLNRLPMPGSLD